MRLSREQFAEFVEREDMMLGLACYVVEREQGGVGNWFQNWDEGMKVAQEYEGHITVHQFNYAVLMQSQQTEARGKRSPNEDEHTTKNCLGLRKSDAVGARRWFVDVLRLLWGRHFFVGGLGEVGSESVILPRHKEV